MALSKKILLVNFSSDWGGGEVQFLELAKEFKRQGHHPTLLTSANSELEDRAKAADLQSLSIRVGKLTFISIFKIFEIQRLLKRIKPDSTILNSSLEMKHLATATSKNKNHLIYRRGYFGKIKPSLLNQFLFKRISELVANSHFVKNHALKEISTSCSISSTVIHNGIPSIEGDSTIDYTNNSILAMGRLISVKQFDLLIKAMPTILETLPDAQLNIVGEGEEFSQLTTLISDLKLKQNVHLLGFSKDVKSHLDKCSLFVHPAEFEAFGVVFLEAMRQRVPSIAFKRNAAEEIIEHNISGILIDEMTSAALADSITKALQDPAKLKKMGEASYKRFIADFTIKSSVDKFLKLITN